MNWLKQFFAMTAMNIRNIPHRPGASAVAVIGVAAVVGVFAAVLSMAAGFKKTMEAGASPDSVIIMRKGATAELNSGLSQEQADIIRRAAGIAKGEDGKPLASAELYVIVDVPIKSDPSSSANVPFRGVEAEAFQVRDGMKLVEGRRFEPGKYELIVGRGASNQFAGLEVGQSIRFGQIDWQVVGKFSMDSGVEESEVWTDVHVLQDAYQRGSSFQSVRAKLTSASDLETLSASLADDPRLNMDVERESDYLAKQSEGLAKFIVIVGYPLTVLMAFGAVFGALNTMYSSVSARAREIATLRAVGFGPMPVALSTLVESAVLALLGGLVGAVVVYLVFNGYQVATLNGSSFSQVVFAFAVTPSLIGQGLIAALIIGLVGGVFPAIRAARLPVARALREL